MPSEISKTGAIYLYDDNIVPDGHEDMCTESLRGITKIGRTLGPESLNEVLPGERFHLVAWANRNEAVLQRRKKIHEAKEKCIVLDGGIIINQLSSDRVKGLTCIRVGRIWMATADIKDASRDGTLLKGLILGDNPEKYNERIKAILLGYTLQEESRERNRSREI